MNAVFKKIGVTLITVLLLSTTVVALALDKQEVHSDALQIEHVMKAQFDKPDAPLKVSPVSVEGDYAVAGWTQGERGGRALLKKEHNKWSIHLCAGDGLTKAETLKMTGMDADAAQKLGKKVIGAESKLTKVVLAKFASFEGMVKVDGDNHQHGQHQH